jgi:GNAT superfamily N-acetyltransferase
MLEPFKSIADPSFILFADVDGETVGFLPGLPNLNEILIDVNGLRYPWDALKLLWLMKFRVPRSMTVKSILVLPEHWNTGVTIQLVATMLKKAQARGYDWVDLSITSADNPTSVLTAEKMGAEIYKRWQVYHLPVS